MVSKGIFHCDEAIRSHAGEKPIRVSVPRGVFGQVKFGQLSACLRRARPKKIRFIALAAPIV